MVQQQLTLNLSVSLAIQHFNLHQRTSRATPKTLDYYAYTLGKFQAWLTQQGIDDILQVSTMHLRTFMLELETTLSPNSVHSVMRGVRALFGFLEREELITQNPMRRVSMPKLDKTILPAFSDQELNKLMAATEGREFLEVRNRALILFLLDTGVRLQECSSLLVQDVDWKTGMVKVMGKGRKERWTRVGSKAMMALNRYMLHRPNPQPSDALWITPRGPVTRNGLAEIIEKLGKRAGVHAHPHKFRRTCALMMLRNGADIFSVQFMLGHSDLEVMRRYLAQTQQDISSAHTKFSPVDGAGI